MLSVLFLVAVISHSLFFFIQSSSFIDTFTLSAGLVSIIIIIIIIIIIAATAAAVVSLH